MIKTVAGSLMGLSLLSMPVAAKEPPKNDPNEIVCKHEKKTNSRFTTKTCHTRAQWAAIAEQNKRDYAETRNRPAISVGGDR